MKIICISASNVKNMRNNSVSTKTCEFIKDIVLSKYQKDAEVEIVRLLDYDLQPCIMCTGCAETGLCLYDEAFNQIYSQLIESDGIFVVCPHYATIPVKLVMILEKLQEMAFILMCKNQRSGKKDKFTLLGKPIVIIGHGGMTGEIEEPYTKALLDPLSYAFASVQMKVIGLNEEKKGVVFGVKDYVMTDEKLLPDAVHDWDQIQQIISPIIKNMFELINQ